MRPITGKCKVELTTETDFLHRDRQRTSRYFHLPKLFSRSLMEKLEIRKDTDAYDQTNDSFIDSILTKIQEIKTQSNPSQNTARLEAYDKLFNLIIARFTTHQSLLAEIKREYDLVLKSLINHHNEVEYLRSKIKKLICEVGTPEMLTRELARVTMYQYELDSVKVVNEKLKKRHAKSDLVFMKHLGDLFEKELGAIHDENQKMNFKFKGHKVFINDWFSAREGESDIFRDLQQRYNNDEFSSIEKKVVIEEDSSPEEREQLKESIASLQGQIKRASEKVQTYTEEVDSFTKKIEEVIMIQRMQQKSSLKTPP